MNIMPGLLNLQTLSAAETIENPNNLSDLVPFSFEGDSPFELELQTEDFSLEALNLPKSGKMLPEMQCLTFEALLGETLTKSLNDSLDVSLDEISVLDEHQEAVIASIPPLFHFVENDIEIHFFEDVSTQIQMSENQFAEKPIIELRGLNKESLPKIDEEIGNKIEVSLEEVSTEKPAILAQNVPLPVLSGIDAEFEQIERVLSNALNITRDEHKNENLHLRSDIENELVAINHQQFFHEETLESNLSQQNTEVVAVSVNESKTTQNNLISMPIENTANKTNDTETEFKNILNKETVIDSKRFDQDLADKIQVMIKTKENTANVNIDPPELGSIEIKIVQDTDKTHITFHAHLEPTRELIESNLFKLRSQMMLQGLHLGDVSVSSGQTGQEQQYSRQSNAFYPVSLVETEGEAAENLTLPLSSGQLDLYV